MDSYKKTQLILVSLLIIFSNVTIPGASFLPFSPSFLFGSVLIFFTVINNANDLNPTKISLPLVFFLVVAVFSILFAEININSSHFKIIIQTTYWLLISIIITNSYDYISKSHIAKIALIISISILFLRIFFPFSSDSQNSTAFSIIMIGPFAYYYFKGNISRIILGLVIVLLMLLIESRTGLILAFLQFLLLIIFRYYLSIKSVFIVGLLTFFLVLPFFNESTRNNIADFIRPYNKRVSLLLTNFDAVMELDKSWLVRKAQVQKGLQLFRQNPFLGIGYSNFAIAEFQINYEDFSPIAIDRLSRLKVDNRSSHNSYIQLLSETGALGAGLIFSFLFACLYLFLSNVNKLRNSFELHVFVSFLGLTLYFYNITAFFGTSTWISFGLFAGAVNYIRS